MCFGIQGCQRDWSNPSDPGSARFDAYSEAYLETCGPGQVMVGDTLWVCGGVRSRGVEQEGLVSGWYWDLDGDGQEEYRGHRNDTLAVTAAYPGDRKVTLRLVDRLGHESRAEIAVHFAPHSEVIDLGPRDPAPGIDRRPEAGDTAAVPDSCALPGATDLCRPVDSLDAPEPGCAFFAQRAEWMEAYLRLRLMKMEERAQDALGLVQVAERLGRDLLGSPFPLSLAGSLGYGFSQGVYSLKSGSLQVSWMLLEKRSDGSLDTLPHDLFALESYLSDVYWDPWKGLCLTRGPLYSRIDGEIDYDRHTGRVGFSLEVSGLFLVMKSTRSESYLPASFPLGEDTVSLQIRAENRSSLGPVALQSVGALVREGGLAVDQSGSFVEVHPSQLPMRYIWQGVMHTEWADFSMRQRLDSALTHYRKNAAGWHRAGGFLERGGVQLGPYQAQVWARGNVDSGTPDTTQFFCDPARQSPFGILAEDPNSGPPRFTSHKYGYSLQLTQTPW